jgi:hypothetical protein
MRPTRASVLPGLGVGEDEMSHKGHKKHKEVDVNRGEEWKEMVRNDVEDAQG